MGGDGSAQLPAADVPVGLARCMAPDAANLNQGRLLGTGLGWKSRIRARELKIQSLPFIRDSRDL